MKNFQGHRGSLRTWEMMGKILPFVLGGNQPGSPVERISDDIEKVETFSGMFKYDSESVE